MTQYAQTVVMYSTAVVRAAWVQGDLQALRGMQSSAHADL